MQLTFTGKQVDLGEALRRHAGSSVEAILEKYFKSAIEAHIVVSKEAHLVRAEISLHIGRGIVVNAGAADNDAFAAFDIAAERVAKQLRRHKRRLRDHHAKARETAAVTVGAGDDGGSPAGEPAETETAVLDPGEDAVLDPGEAAAAVIAESCSELPRLTVGEAAMRIDLGEMPVLLFCNCSDGEINLVYRRADGNIGWIEPGRRAG
ncbi:MAG: ribosome hibernation-promoting factor, HPF/YfiA family [Stellaceae bacterium]